jgi:hypothetical protein
MFEFTSNLNNQCQNQDKNNSRTDHNDAVYVNWPSNHTVIYIYLLIFIDLRVKSKSKKARLRLKSSFFLQINLKINR